MNSTVEIDDVVVLTAIYQKKYNDYFFNNQKSMACPYCDNPIGLRIHGKYKRHIYIDRTQRVQINISRMICTCGKTFVVLPPEIIPFKRYILKQILEVIRLSQNHSVY